MLQNGLKFLKSFLIRSLVPGSSHGSGWSEIGKSFYPPPYFSLKHSHCIHKRESKTSSFLFALKCALVCFALAFFALTGNAQTTTNCSDTVTTGVPQAQCLALIDLYNQTNGTGWTDSDNWNGPLAINTWDRVTVSGGQVTRLLLSDNN